MRWIPTLLIAWALVLAQTTVGRVLLTPTLPLVGTVGPDLLAVLAMFIVLNARLGADAVLACAALGAMVDLTTAGGTSSGTVVGPMVLGYALGGWAVVSIRDAFFRNRFLPQTVLGLVMIGLAHVTWVVLQTVACWQWSELGGMLLQAAGITLYTSLLVWVGGKALTPIRPWMMTAVPGRSRRDR